MDTSSKKIRDLNDRFRHGDDSVPGRLLITAGVHNLANGKGGDVSDVIAKVRAFKDFGPDNDPHGEHDFGAFEAWGEIIFWKFDYFAPELEHGSEDPADPAKAVRVLTIMLASEY